MKSKALMIIAVAALGMSSCKEPTIFTKSGSFPIEKIDFSDDFGSTRVLVELSQGVPYDEAISLSCFGNLWGVWAYETAAASLGPGRMVSNHGLESREYETDNGRVQYYDLLTEYGNSVRMMECFPAENSLDRIVNTQIIAQLQSDEIIRASFEKTDVKLVIAAQEGHPISISLDVRGGKIEEMHINGLENAIKAQNSSPDSNAQTQLQGDQ